MDTEEFSRFGHVFRPGPLRRARSFWLNGDVLHWRVGRRKGHLDLREIREMAVLEQRGGKVCRLIDGNGRPHRISERHWFGFDVAERHRFGSSELRSATFSSLVEAIRRRLNRLGR